MGLVNLNNTAQVADYSGNGTAGRRARFFQANSDILAPIYADPNLTVTMAQPIVADEHGQFELSYLIDGAYRVVITDSGNDVLHDVPDIEVSAEAEQGYRRVFLSMSHLLEDSSLSYSEQTGQRRIRPGAVLRVLQENTDFRVVDAEDADYHTETAGGVRLKVSGSIWHASAFGVVADSDPTGTSGTDNGQSFTRMAEALSTYDGAVEVVFPRGTLRSSATFNIESDVVKDVQIRGDGTHIVFTHPTPATNRRYLSVRNTATSGKRCVIDGITLDLNRNPVRTGGSDMLSIGGFSDVDIFNTVIPSADNMAISVDRALVTKASSVHIKDNRIGGKPPVSGGTHNYGSIGDTGIWVLHAGAGTVITGNVVHGTGDDGIAVAETAVSPAFAPAIISDNIVRNCQGTAYKSSAAFSILADNFAENLVNDMYRIIDLGIDGGSTMPMGFQITGGYGKNIGTADAASLGVSTMLASVHGCGVHLQNAVGKGSISGLHLVNTSEEALKISTTQRGMDGLELQGCILDNIGQTGSAVIRREGASAPHAATNISVTNNTIRNTQARLLAWECNLNSGNEGQLTWQNNHILECNFSGNSEIFTFTGSQTPRLQGIKIAGDHWRGVTSPSSALIDLHNADPSEFAFWVHDNCKLTALPLGGVRMRNNQNPGLVGIGPECRIRRSARKTIPGSREMTDNVLLTLDPSKGWEIEAKGIRNSANSYNSVYYKATWDPLFGRVLHESSLGGGPGADCSVELIEVTPANASDQPFSGTEVLQLRGTSTGWTSGGSPFDPMIAFQVSWREIDDNAHPAKIT
ncbi:hypothetical protein [uncultured Pelagimonas sp.]|uniref:hypothetical protein n=1 Tax=uncultured Pelagimonas sp. TaxID=1618102 RepID=UPI002634287D|nr:hypothetical protein [uncultured Pelagimonas sp.]